MADAQLTNDEAAALATRLVSRPGSEIKPASWRRYVSDGRAPKPDGHLGRTPWWSPGTIEQWAASRPGQGKGGGRPRKGE